MLEVYDRVIPSKSIPTLVALALLAAALYLFQGLFELLRGRMLVRIAGTFDEMSSTRMFRALIKVPLKIRMSGDQLQPLRDFDQIRTFVSGMGPIAAFDLPWIPFYVVICFLFHPAIGFIAIGGAVTLAFLAFLNDRGTRTPAKQSTEAANLRYGFMQTTVRNSEVIQAMGMVGMMSAQWESHNTQFRRLNRKMSDAASGYSTLSKVFRIAFQSATLATGALLVIKGEASSGIIIAGSILTSRTLAPVEQAIGNWRSFLQVQQSWKRLSTLMRSLPEGDELLVLPPPKQRISVEGLASAPPSANAVVISDVTFSLTAGSAMCVVGQSASGKSSLARAILGLWPAVRGSVRLDGAALDQWDGDDLGASLGYLPQEVELFAGTIAQNICRFTPKASAEGIIGAARAAGVHDLIVRFPNGYDTRVEEGGKSLSAGQRQRIALARALYGNPFLLVLDEPNSNLDEDGERALSSAIASARARGAIVIIVTHRTNVLSAVDYLLVMQNGKMAAFGPKDDVLRAIAPKNAAPRSNMENAQSGGPMPASHDERRLAVNTERYAS